MGKKKLPSYQSLTSDVGFFSLQPLLSRGKHLNIVCGQRSSGKSVGTSLWLLLEFLNKGRGFIYTRRTKDELDETASTWFNNAVQILQSKGVDVKVEYRRGSYYITYEGEERECGRAIALSLENKHKGDNLSLFRNIVFDEFISKNPNSYLGNRNTPIFEYSCLISLYQTADRDIGQSFANDTYIICLGNYESLYNPVFRGAGIDRYLNADTPHFLSPKNEEFAVQFLTVEDSPAVQNYKESIGYKLSDKRTRDYSYENKNRESYDNEFIEKIVEPMEEICGLQYDGMSMKMSYSWKRGIFYIEPGSTSKRSYALTAIDHTPNYFLVSGYNSCEEVKQLKTLYTQGRVRFYNQKCKFCIDSFFRLVL